MDFVYKRKINWTLARDWDKLEFGIKLSLNHNYIKAEANARPKWKKNSFRFSLCRYSATLTYILYNTEREQSSEPLLFYALCTLFGYSAYILLDCQIDWNAENSRCWLRRKVVSNEGGMKWERHGYIFVIPRCSLKRINNFICTAAKSFENYYTISPYTLQKMSYGERERCYLFTLRMRFKRSYSLSSTSSFGCTTYIRLLSSSVLNWLWSLNRLLNRI